MVPPSHSRQLLGAVLAGVICASLYALSLRKAHGKRKADHAKASDIIDDDYDAVDTLLASVSYAKLIGNTPMVKLERISKRLNCDLYVKMESMNPGGTGKDRAALYMLRDCLKRHAYGSGERITIDCASNTARGLVVEGTSGSTGIALANLCLATGLQLHVVMPDDQSAEKKMLLERLGAKVTIVPNCGISNEDNYVNTARRIADEQNGVFINQFNNTSNYDSHFEKTGPEIWRQCNGKIDAFVMSAGTGGTIAGVSKYLKEKTNGKVKVYLADPPGSSLLHRVQFGVCYTPHQAERTVKKHRYDTIVEGVGLDRVTDNFERAEIDDGFAATDQEVLEMAHFLLREEGLFVGSSSSLNVVAAVRAARSLASSSEAVSGGRRAIVTVVCDSGSRHLSRFWNRDYVEKNNLTWPENDSIPLCLREYEQQYQ